jgi:hypothetical protein
MNLLVTRCDAATCAGSARPDAASPATPAASLGSLARSFLGAHAATARTETCRSGFLPSVVLATSLVWIRLAAAHCPVMGLYGYALHCCLQGWPASRQPGGR